LSYTPDGYFIIAQL